MERQRVKLTKPNSKGVGQLTYKGDKKSKTYRINKDIADQVPSTGLYDAVIKESFGTYNGRPYTSIWVNEVYPASIESIDDLYTLLRTSLTKRRAEAIIQALQTSTDSAGALSLEQAVEYVSDTNFLTKIRGIGQAVASKIQDKLGGLKPTDLRLVKILRKWNINIDAHSVKYEWLRHFYHQQPEWLDYLDKDPYTIFYATDKEVVEARLAARKYPWIVDQGKKRPIPKLKFSDIDSAILGKHPEWREERSRVILLLEDAYNDIQRSGHTVASVSAITKTLYKYGISNVKSLYNEEGDIQKGYFCSLTESVDKIENDVLRDLIKSSENLVYVNYSTIKGESKQGITSRKALHWQRTISSGVTKLIKQPSIFSVSEQTKMVNKAVEQSGVKLSNEQIQGIKFAYSGSISCLTGGAGSGKTTVSQAVINGYLTNIYPQNTVDPIMGGTVKREPCNVYILAPTGIAAQRIRLGLKLKDPIDNTDIIPGKVDWKRDSTGEYMFQNENKGRVSIGTLHSFLGYNSIHYNLPDPHNSIIFLDESSMVDEEPFSHLMEYVSNCLENGNVVSIFLAGDTNQLPPVGPGYPFRDIIGGPFGSQVPVTKLKQIHRQAEGSMVLHAAYEVLDKRLPPTTHDYKQWGYDPEEEDFIWDVNLNPKDVVKTLRDYAKKHNVKDLSSIQVILALRNPSKVDQDAWYTREANKVLQDYLTKQRKVNTHRFNAISRDTGKPYTVALAQGDKVVHIGQNGYKNGDHEPINKGSIGYIQYVDPANNIVEVKYPWLKDGVVYEQPDEIAQLSLAYAITGHSTQGSEFEHVLLFVPSKAGPTLIDRNWLYTTITRTSHKCLFIATVPRIKSAVRKSFGLSRDTLLAQSVVTSN